MQGMQIEFNCRAQVQAKRHALGFTLTELMVTIAIMAILATFALPAFEAMIRNNRLSAASSSLQVSLSLARAEAIKAGSNSRVWVVPASSGDFTTGWTVFYDARSDSTFSTDNSTAPTADDTNIRRIEVVAAPSASTSSPLTVSYTGGLSYFIYNGQGRLVSDQGALANRSFSFSMPTSDLYCVVISASGRIRNARVSNTSNCPSS
jgi:type IV fimbrial biogenesis protein FimT